MTLGIRDKGPSLVKRLSKMLSELKPGEAWKLTIKKLPKARGYVVRARKRIDIPERQ